MLELHGRWIQMDGLYVLKSDSAGIILDNMTKGRLNRFEVSRHTLPKGTLFYIYPQTGEDSLLAYYIKSGDVHILETDDRLGPGDIIINSGLDAMSILHFISEVTLVVFKYNEDAYISFEARVKKMDLIMSKIQEKDHYTKQHCDRVTSLVKMMGLALGYKSMKFNHLNKAARFHDLGKVLTPDSILNKPGPLTYEEFEVIKKHPCDARVFLENLFDEEIIDIVEKHHECLDGSGYPCGLAADAIREESRIIAICDSFEAMTSDRVYKKKLSVEVAFQELRKYSGNRYDPLLVELFISEYSKAKI